MTFKVSLKVHTLFVLIFFTFQNTVFAVIDFPKHAVAVHFGSHCVMSNEGCNKLGIDDFHYIPAGMEYQYAIYDNYFHVSTSTFFDKFDSGFNKDNEDGHFVHRYGQKIDFGINIINKYLVYGTVGLSSTKYQYIQSKTTLSALYGMGMYINLSDRYGVSTEFDIQPTHIDGVTLNVFSMAFSFIYKF